MCMLNCFSHAWLFVTLWIVAHQAPLSGKNIGVGCHVLLQGIFLTQRSNPGLLYCRQFLYRLNHQRSPYMCIYIYIGLYFDYLPSEKCSYVCVFSPIFWPFLLNRTLRGKNRINLFFCWREGASCFSYWFVNALLLLLFLNVRNINFFFKNCSKIYTT